MYQQTGLLNKKEALFDLEAGKEENMPTERNVVLIVDDVELNRAILNELFYQEYEILEAENGRQALEYIEQYKGKIATILLDIIMPEVDGFGVLEEMGRQNLLEQIPVFLITSENSDKATIKGFEMGVVDIINKPINPGIVRRRVNNTIELYKHRYQLEDIVKEQMYELEQQASKIKTMNTSIIDTLSTVIEFRDCESGHHIQRIRSITRILLMEIQKMYPEYGLTPQSIEVISNAAVMHDVGKISIPDYILTKPGKLTKEEFEIMKEHTIRGCEILESIHFLQDDESFQFCYDICRHHHEKWDGRGYPDGLKGNEISIWAQVVSLADVYEALISKRIYKPPYTHQEACAMIKRGECGAFNPAMMECFEKVAPTLEQMFSEVSSEEYSFYYERLNPLTINSHTPNIPPSLTDRTLRLLELERDKYRILSDLSDDVMFDYDLETGVVEFSDRFYDMFDLEIKKGERVEKYLNCEIIHPEDWMDLEKKVKQLSEEQPAMKMELRIQLPNKELEWFEIYIHTLWDKECHGKCLHYIGKLMNINALKEETSRWRHKARTDALTGLYNRNAVKEMVSELIDKAKDVSFSLLFIDIDNFKKINDSMGHLFGDKVLRHVAKKIENSLRCTDIVGRIGGDEFIVVLKDLVKKESVEKKAEEVCQIFRGEFKLEDKEYKISGSVGIARYPLDSKDYEELLHKADQALYYAKNRGKDTYYLYVPEMEKIPFRSVLSEVDGNLEQHGIV